MKYRSHLSNLLGDASSFGHVVLPVFHLHCFLALSLKDFFIIWVFSCFDSISLIFGFLPGHCVSVLFLGQLLKCLGWLIVPRSEDLLLVLVLKINSLVHCALIYDDSLIRVLIGVHDILAVEVLVLWAHHIRHFVKTVLGDALHL